MASQKTAAMAFQLGGIQTGKNVEFEQIDLEHQFDSPKSDGCSPVTGFCWPYYGVLVLHMRQFGSAIGNLPVLTRFNEENTRELPLRGGFDSLNSCSNVSQSRRWTVRYVE